MAVESTWNRKLSNNTFNGSCQYSPFINFGCTYDFAVNYNDNSNVEDGTCEYNFSDLNGDGNINILDIVHIVNTILFTP